MTIPFLLFLRYAAPKISLFPKNTKNIFITIYPKIYQAHKPFPTG